MFRLHCIVLGPGLGRNQSMLGRISLILDKVDFNLCWVEYL